MRIHNQIKVNRSLPEVFAFLSNFENMSKWNYYIITVQKATDGPLNVGTVFNQVRKSDAQQYRITIFLPPHEVMVETLPPERYVTTHFKLSADGSGTLIDDTIIIRLPPIIDWFAQFGAGRIQRAVFENLQRLKILLETGEVTLQDGRRERIR